MVWSFLYVYNIIRCNQYFVVYYVVSNCVTMHIFISVKVSLSCQNHMTGMVCFIYTLWLAKEVWVVITHSWATSIPWFVQIFPFPLLHGFLNRELANASISINLQLITLRMYTNKLAMLQLMKKHPKQIQKDLLGFKHATWH